MKKFFTLLVSFALPLLMLAQETDKKVTVKFGGFVRNEMMYNTRQNVSARNEGMFYLAPKPIVYDAIGNDINSAPNFNMVGLNTRLNVKVTGPDAFGAKTSAFVEGDFFGISKENKFAFRMRHAMMKLDWGGSNLLIGQYWHPNFITGCYPATVSFGAGVPMNPFARVPQLRYTYNVSDKLSVFGAMMAQGHFKSKEPVGGTPGASFNNAGIPEFHAQVQYKSDNVLFGVGVDYQLLKPALTTNGLDTSNMTYSIPLTTDATIASLSYLAYLNIKTKPLTFKAFGMYGQNNDNLVMMGGYAQMDNSNYTLEQLMNGYVEYTPYNILSSWVDIHTNGKKFQYGLFAGYAQNMGSDELITRTTFEGRWGDVNTMIRVAPRVTMTSGKMKFGIEAEYSAVDYAKGDAAGTTLEELTGINDNGVVTNYETADNLKLIIMFQYNF